MAKKKKSSGTLNVDFTGVETGKGGKPVPEGDYTVTVMAIENKESSNGNPMLNWELEIADGKYKGRKLYHRTMLTAQSLWNLRKTLEALGIEVPSAAMDIDLKALRGLSMGVTVEHEEYKGKEKAAITDTFPLEDDEEDSDEEEDEDEEEEETPPPSKKKSSKKSAPEPEEEEDDEDESEDDEDEEDEEEEEPAPPKKKSKKTPPPSDDEDEEDEESEEDEEDEDEEPAPPKKSSKKKSKK